MDEKINRVVNKDDDDTLAICLAGVRQFLIQSPDCRTLPLLMLVKTCGNINNIELSTKVNSLPVFSFDIEDNKGQNHRVKCNPAAMAFLHLVQIFGQSIFVDYSGDKKPYLKACGRIDESPGIVVARIITGALSADLDDDLDYLLKGETVTYKNKDTLDLTVQNLEVSKPVHRRMKKGPVTTVAYALHHVGATADCLFPGDAAAKYKAAGELLRQSTDYLEFESSNSQR